MARVPVTRGSGREIQAYGRDRLQYAAPRNFVGGAIEQAGAGLQRAAQDFDQIEAIYDEADALRIANEFGNYERERLRNGENAYLTTEGFQAGEGREGAIKDLQTGAENLLGAARSERARNMARRALDTRLGNAQNLISDHAVGQMQAARQQQSEARIGSAVTDAIDTRGTDMFAVNLAVAEQELRGVLGRKGAAPETVAEAVDGLYSDAYARTVLAIDAEDGEPTRAMQFLEENAGLIDPAKERELRNSLGPRVLMARMDEVVSGGGLESYIPAAQAAPAEPGTAPNIDGDRGAVAGVLAQAGFSPAVVAGFLGNFEVEGGYGGARGDGGSASGIAQWRNDRRANFVRMFGKDPHEASPMEQANFVVWEVNNPRAAGMTTQQRDAILGAVDPGQAAELIDRHYERSSGAHRGRRAEEARRFAGVAGAPGVAADPRLNSLTMREAAKQYAADNGLSEAETQALYASADKFVGERRGDRAQAEQDADRRVMDWLNQNMPGPDDLTSMAQIPAAVRDGASPSTVAALQNRVQQTQDRRQAAHDAAAAERAESMEQAAVFELYTMSDEQLASVDMRRYAGRIGLDKLGPWIDRQQRASGQGSSKPVSSDTIAAALDRIGPAYGASRKPDAKDEDRQAWIALRGYVERQIAGRGNDDLSNEDLRAIIITGMQEVEIPGTGWFRNDRMPASQVPVGGAFNATIPTDIEREIEAQLTARLGRRPPRDEVWKAYQQGRARGIYE